MMDIKLQIDKAVAEIMYNHKSIINNWCKAYAAEIYEKNGTIKPGDFTLFEQEVNEDGKYGKKYWFEYSGDNFTKFNEWKPIETAPKNGEIILIALPGEDFEPDMVYYENCKWKLCYGGLYIDDTYRYRDQSNLVWMKLPRPPTKEKHFCEHPDYPIKCITNDEGNLNLVSTHDKVSYVTQVVACPFCGEKK